MAEPQRPSSAPYCLPAGSNEAIVMLLWLNAYASAQLSSELPDVALNEKIIK